MKKLNKIRFTSLLVAPILVAMVATPIITRAAQPTVNLGTTSTFAVLAGSTITNTGTTVIEGSNGGNVDGKVGGDVGLFPGTAFDGRSSVTVSGTVHLNDAAAIKAKDDLVTAYNDAAGRKPVTTIPSELGGTILKPGTYDSADGTFQITGKLTLDAQGDPDGVFVFKTASTLKTASASSVIPINGARFCRTFWKVGSSVTLGTYSSFVGHIFAMESITATTGAKIQGQLLARTGAVTLDTNTITNGYCAVTGEKAGTSTTTGGKAGTSTTTGEKAGASTTTGEKTIKTTVSGGQLPKTSTPLYGALLMGVTLTLFGVICWGTRKRYE